MRNLTKTLAAVSLLVPASAYPLGIGEIKLHSALNQNLDAEIALLISENENAAEVKVRLAPPEKFDEAGVPWSYFLSKIKFESVTRHDGSTIIKLSSKEALREPFLDFLLEVTWDKGNLYREFTVLVDPPAAYNQPIIPIVEKVEQPVDEVVETEEGQIVEAVKEIVVVNELVDSEYGPTTKTDSLWTIAERSNKYDDVSIEQMMMAIYDANPKAFYKDNVNALMAGKTLSIPEKEIIVKLSQKQALAAFKQQANEWKGRVSTKKADPKPLVEKIEVNNQLELEAPVEAEIAEAVTVVSDVETVTEVSPEQESKIAIDSGNDASTALQVRMEKLEQQLLMMQKMLVLKDEQIAALQHKKNDKPTESVNELKPVVVDAKATSKPGDISTETKPVVKTVDKEIIKPQPKPAVKPKPVAKPKAKPVRQPEPEPGFMDEYFTLVVGGAGAAILALLGWLFWRKRKIEEETDDESMFAAASEISLPDSDSSMDDLTSPVLDDASYDVGTVGESSFLSEFTPSDFDAFDTDQNEVDPISEADVYLAYGRYQQAEDLMRQAIVDQPGRDECKLKLLEIFYANENKAAFEEYATELVSAGKHNDSEFWPKVVEMGVELDPSSSLFSDSGVELANFEEEPSEKVQVAAVEDSDKNDLPASQSLDEENDFDLSIFDTEESDSTAVAEESKEELDFDLSVFDLDDSSDEKSQADADDTGSNTEEALETVDFDLSTVTSDSVEEEKPEQVSADEEIESFDFNLDSSDLNTEPEEKPEVEEVEAIDLSAELDSELSLDDFNFSLDDEADAPAEPKESEGDSKPASESADFDDFDFDFDLEVPTTPAADASAELGGGVSDLTDMDELETKMDLAKAYVDMGDPEAAKAIAEEVLEKGSQEQKQAAQAIIDQLQ